jgi:hypothetical protein
MQLHWCFGAVFHVGFTSERKQTLLKEILFTIYFYAYTFTNSEVRHLRNSVFLDLGRKEKNQYLYTINKENFWAFHAYV